ncbi:DUF55-domain-containing protein [Pleurotus pulmonarius]
MSKFWLLKAEPDSRIVKGKDVKFSVDDFEKIQTTAWEGVRNYEARNLMKEMKAEDMAVFYHSNCKVPGIAALAKVSKEAYPDYTAWDPKHPYFDAKTDKENPKWYMVDLTFVERAKNFIPLALLRYIADISSTTPPPELEYIGEDGINAIKGMDLVTRGRLSVQRVSEEAWNTIQLLAERGGWDDLNLKASPQKKSNKATVENKRKAKITQRKAVDEQDVAEGVAPDVAEQSPLRAPGRKRKREATNIDPEAVEGAQDSEARPLRRSGRFRK